MQAVNEFPIQPFSALPSLQERIEPLGREAARRYWTELKKKQGVVELPTDKAQRAANYEYVQLLCLDKSVRRERIKAQLMILKGESDAEPEAIVDQLVREEAAYAGFKRHIRNILGTDSTDTRACLERATQRGEKRIASSVAGYLLGLEEASEPLLERVCMHLINQASLDARTNEPTRMQTFSDHPLFAQVLSGLTRAQARKSKAYRHLRCFLDEALRPIVDLTEPSIPNGPSNPKGRKFGAMSGIG